MCGNFGLLLLLQTKKKSDDAEAPFEVFDKLKLLKLMQILGQQAAGALSAVY
jgi:hypothetical protein